ncbi:MAG: restriction endonuclease subunit S [Pseudonocardiaceae bacterium]
MSGWVTARLGDIVSIVGGGTPTRTNPDYYGGEIPWVTPKDMKSNYIDKSLVTLTQNGLSNSPTRLIPSNSILIVVRSGVLKHTVPIAVNTVPVAINQDMKALMCSEQIDPNFLARFVKARSTEILRWVRATTADNFPTDRLRELSVPIPPLGEQRTIAKILDQADLLGYQRRKTIAHLDELSQSMFREMFGDLTRKQENYNLSNLKDIVSEFRYGTSIKSQSQGVPTLRIPNVTNSEIDTSDLKLVPVSTPELGRLRLLDGDLLIVRTNGNPDLVGRCAIYNSEVTTKSGRPGEDFIYASYLIRARPKMDVISPVYLREFLLGPTGRRALRSRSKTSAGQFNINTESLGAIKVPVPPLDLQHEYARRVRAVERLKASQRAHLAELDALFASLQYRAFRGEL